MAPFEARAKAVFSEALDLAPGPDRDAFVRSACDEDEMLRARVASLLEAFAMADQFLATRPTPIPQGDETIASSGPPAATEAEAPLIQIGPFRLIRRVGEGGMGVVYLAEQERPVRRLVALKVIKAGMDTDRVVARFEAERQALAIMDHPGIARVLDAGATDAGRPYFVMDFVDGEPITDYCDRKRLSVRSRIELLIAVCRAVQHAHQKGIIHRDLKPSNVLVAEADGRPATKVIDFGVAKAVDASFADQSLFTHPGNIVGTPEYMSPEQAGGAPDVDTRADVYALGVLLYELLTGSTPLGREGLRRAAMLEVLRKVREEEPPKPSTRLSDSGDRLASISAARDVEPARLSRQVRGELDWIAMKAIEKDRARRYGTPADLAADLERHLDGQAVEAGPPSRSYRLSKFARRHRVGLATAVSAWLAVEANIARGQAVGAGDLARTRLVEVEKANAATTRALADANAARARSEEALADAQAARARSDEARAEAEATTEFLADAFRRPDPSLDGRELKVVDLLDDAVKRLGPGFKGSARSRAGLLLALGRTYLGLGLYPAAKKVLADAGRLADEALGPGDPASIAVRHQMATANQVSGSIDEAIPLFESVLRAQEAAVGPGHHRAILARLQLAICLQASNRGDEARRVLAGRLEADEAAMRAQVAAVVGPGRPAALANLGVVAHSYQIAGRLDDSIRVYEEILGPLEEAVGPVGTEAVIARANLANSYLFARRIDDMIRLRLENLRIQERRLGYDHPRTTEARNSLAAVYRHYGRPAEAVRLYQEALAARVATLGEGHAETLRGRDALASALAAADRLDEAIPLYEATLRARESLLGPDHLDTLGTRGRLAQALRDSGRLGEAIPLFEATLRGREKVQGPTYADSLWARDDLALAYRVAGRVGEAIPLLEATLKARMAKLRPDHPNLARSRANLALAYGDSGRPAEALALLQPEISRLSALDDAPDATRARDALARTLLDIRRPDLAEPIWRRVAAARRPAAAGRTGPFQAPSFGSPEWLLADTLAGLGASLIRLGRPGEAEPVLRECLALRERILSPAFMIAEAEGLLGDALLDLGRPREAEPLALAALRDAKASLATIERASADQITEAGERVVRLYEALGRPSTAASWRSMVHPPEKLPADVFAR